MTKFSPKWFAIPSWGMRVAVAVILLMQSGAARSAAGFSSDTVGFTVRFKDETSSYRVMGVFVLAREVLTLEIPDARAGTRYLLDAPTGIMKEIAANRWEWQSPQEAGLYPLAITHPESGDSMMLNVFVMVPYEKLQGEYLGGYRISAYPSIPWKGLSIYKPPRGFIEVTKENEEALVSPHFKLGQFLCKQESGYPKYLVLKEKLLLKLELILGKVNERGCRCETFHVMSGYRTPYYNRAIGNVKYSRHIYGDAADIFIDENPEDGMMDDLNKDGRIDYRDAAILYDIIDEMYGKPWYRAFVGGLSWYKKSQSHGPFVHVDVRGLWTRWGD